MRIRNDSRAGFAWRAFKTNAGMLDRNLTRLSSGLRIATAGEDPSGLSMSERIRSQFTGLVQATRNARDGISLINTADGAMNEIVALLQRGRELALQATNGVLETSQVSALQTELDAVLTEVDRIVDTTTYNGIALFGGGGHAGTIAQAVTGIRNGWMQQAEDVIAKYYNLKGDGSQLTVQMTAAGNPTLWIAGSTDVHGLLQNIVMPLDALSMARAGDPDRVVARLFTQAVLARNANYTNLEKWFISGASDLIAGGDEMLATAEQTYGGATLVAAMGTAWADDLLHEASAYLALRYLRDSLAANGSDMISFMNALKAGGDLNVALGATLASDTASFVDDFLINGEAYLANLKAAGELLNTDVGGMNSGDSHQVIPDVTSYSPLPAQGFAVAWQGLTDPNQKLTLQVGPNLADRITVDLPQINRFTLNLLGVDLVTHAQGSVKQFDGALQTLSGARSKLGAASNALEHTISANLQAELQERTSFSRITDVDFAHEVTAMTKRSLLVTASSAMLSQANAMRKNALQLLSGISSGAERAAPTVALTQTPA